MSQLTVDQKNFLDEFLNARPSNKGTLGGKQLTKVKDQYAKYCKLQQKVSSTISQLKGLPLGADIADPMSKAIGVIEQQVEAAADLGDESVFAGVYKELETIGKEASDALSSRKSELKKIAADVKKFQKEYQKVRNEGNKTKQKQQAGKLRDETAKWIMEHHGPDTQEVWTICQLATELAGGPGSDTLAVAARELESEVYQLTKRIDDLSVDDIRDNTVDVKDCIFELNRLEPRLQKFLKMASESGNNFVKAQMERTQLDLMRCRWLIDPPPLPDFVPQIPNQQPQQPQPVQNQNGELPPEKLTNAELADRTLLKSAGLIDHVTTELKRVKGNLKTVKEEVTKAKQGAAPCKDQLEDDFVLLDNATQDADGALLTATNQLKAAETAFDLGTTNKDQEGKWEDHVKDVSNAVNQALAALNLCEKYTGQAEGGILYVTRAVESIQSIKDRVEAVDAELLAAVQERIALLPECKKVTPLASAEEGDMVAHLMFTSAEAPNKLTSLLASGRDADSVKKMIRKLMETPKLGTAAVTGMLARCHQIRIDANRFYGDTDTAREALGSNDLKTRFDTILQVANQDVAKFTIPVIPREKKDGDNTPWVSVGVAVIGGGPVGLLAAVEARMAGAGQVHVYEGRDDPYSRMNVLKIDEAPARRLFAAGVSDAVFPAGYDAKVLDKHIASVRTIENALESRCGSLGIKLERGLFLTDVTRDPSGKVLLHFKGEKDPKTCDVMIVATGGSVASAQKYADNVVLSDKLGIPFQKATVKDYAAVGLFEKTTPQPDTGRGIAEGWAYEFETHEVKYIVTQLSEEEYDEMAKDPRALMEKVKKDAVTKKLAKQPDNAHPVRQSTASPNATVGHDQIPGEIDTAWDKLLQDIGPNNFFGKDVETDNKKIAKAKAKAKQALERKLAEAKKKAVTEQQKKSTTKLTDNEVQQVEAGVKLTPREIEDGVLQFLTLELGVARFPIEIQQAQQFASKDLSGVLVGDSAGTPHPDTSKGFNTGVAEMGAVQDLVQDLSRGTGTEEERKQAMQMYEFEVKRRTDFMIGEGLEALQVRGRERVNSYWMKTIGPMINRVVNPKLNTDGHPWKKKMKSYLESISVPRDQANQDRDWSRRETAVKQIRAFEGSVKQAKTAIEQLITQNETDPAKLMVPLDVLIPNG